MKRKGPVYSSVALKKKKRDYQEAALSEFLLLYEAGNNEKHLSASLTYFLIKSTADDEPQCSGDVQSFVQAYLDKFPDCQHILVPLELEREKRSEDLLLVCFHCLEQVLLFTASPLSSLPAADSAKHYVSVGSMLVSTILTSHMRCIYSCLQTTQPMRLVASCLKLLTAMVLQGPGPARDIQQTFNFGYKPLEVLPSRTHLLQGMGVSVRHCLLKFALSFLIVADSDVISSILELKGLLSSYFKLLPKDSPEIRQLFLSTLLQKVILNTEISKRLKSSFFNHYVLKQTAQLLLVESTESGSGDEESSCSQVAFQFLLRLCTDFQCGICYKSRPPPEGLERSNNPVILHFLLSLAGSLSCPLVQELTTKALAACPDVLLPYFKALTLNFDPQPTAQWMESTEFMIKILSSMPSVVHLLGFADHEAFGDCEPPPPLTYLKAAVCLTVPSSLTRTNLSLGIQHPVPLVKYQTLRLMQVVLERAISVMKYWGPVQTSLTTIESFLICYRDAVMKSIPDVHTLISLRQQLSGSEGKEPAKVDTLSLDDQMRNLELYEDSSLLCLTLTVLRGYQKLSPLLFVQVDFNVAKLLPSTGIDEMTSSDLAVVAEALQVLLESPLGSLKWKQLSSTFLPTVFKLCAICEDRAVSNLALQVAIKFLKQSHILEDYHCELEIILLTLRTHCSGVPREAVSSLIQFITDLFLSTFRDHRSLQARVETIVASRSKHEPTTSSKSSVSPWCTMDEILAAPLVIPDPSTTLVVSSDDDDDVPVQSQLCSLVPCLLSMLKTTTSSDHEVTSFIIDVLPKLILVHRSSSAQLFGAVVLEYLHSSDDGDTESLSQECLGLVRMFSGWIGGDGKAPTAGGASSQALSPKRLRKGRTKSSRIQPPVEGDQLTFLSTLSGALHSEPGTYPLDWFTMAISDQHFCDALEGSFETVTAADSPAMGCSLRAVQVLLSRLHAHWKSSGVNESQAKAVSFLFSLLIKAVKRLSQSFETNDSPVTDEDQLYVILEKVVDKWLVETLFLKNQWLSSVGYEDSSAEQKKKRRRKSRGTPQLPTSIDCLCSSETVQLLHVAIESCSKFHVSPVVRLAVTRMFDVSKMLLEKAQHDGTLGNLLTQIIKLLQVATSSEKLLSYVEELLSHSANYPVELLADILSILLIPPTKIELIQSLQEENVSDDQRWSTSPMCTSLSNSAVSSLISLMYANSCEKLDTITYYVLHCKLEQSHVEGNLLCNESANPIGPTLDKDGLVSSMHSITKALLSSDAALPGGVSVPRNGVDLAVSLSSMSQTSSQAKGSTVDSSGESVVLAREIFDSLQRTCQSNPHSKKLLGHSLCGKLLQDHVEHSPIHGNFRDASFFVDRKDAETLLDHAVASLSPACAKIAGLLVNRSQVLMQHFVSHSISELYGVRVDELEKHHSSGNTEGVTRIHCYLYVMAKFFSALDSNGSEAKLSSDLKRAVKMVRKSLGDRYLFIPLLEENYVTMAVQVIEGVCKHSSKALRHVCEGVRCLDMESGGPWNQYQISIACFVAMAMLDPQLCGIAAKRAVQKLSECLGDELSKQEDQLLKVVLKLFQLMYSKDLSLEVELVAEEWSGFLQTLLRTRFDSPHHLQLVRLLLAVLSENGDIVDWMKLYKAVWSHSQFMPVISDERDERAKECLVELLVAIVEKHPAVCQASHITTLLIAYSATMTTTDRGLLYLLYKYEEQGVSTAAYRPYLWGSAAAQRYQQKREVGWLLWKQPGMPEVMELLDRKCLFLSATNFPISSQLEPPNPFLSAPASEQLTTHYDPCFLLPLLNHLLDPGNVVDCRQFVEHGCLGYLIMALSSRVEEVRAAAGHTLTRFSHHLEGSRFREKVQIVLLLEVLRNTISEPSMRVNSIVAAFCARAARLFLDPDNPLYPVVGHFMVYKPALDLNDIPLFGVLLHSSSTQHKAERRWLLNVLIDGLKCDEDFTLFRKKHVLSQLLSLFSTEMLDHTSKILVMKLIGKAACISNSARDLLFSGGLCSLLCLQ